MVMLDFDMNIRDYVDLVQKRNRPPSDETARCELLAIELVEGQSLIFWDAQIAAPDRSKLTRLDVSVDQLGFLQYYYYKRWRGNPPALQQLQKLNLLDEDMSLSPHAYHLYERHLRHELKIFISYRRSESSVFALYLHEHLADTGYDSFLDMQSLQLGQNWRVQLRESIQNRDYFILLLGKHTLGSKVVVQEVLWALENNMKIIPIWHNGFHYKYDPAHKIHPGFKTLLTDTHTLIIDPENPAQYKRVVHELINYFERELNPD